MTTPRDPIYAGHRYPTEIISYAVWLYFRFPLSLRMVEEMLAARGISHAIRNARLCGKMHRPRQGCRRRFGLSGCGAVAGGSLATRSWREMDRTLGLAPALARRFAARCPGPA